MTDWCREIISPECKYCASRPCKCDYLRYKKQDVRESMAPFSEVDRDLLVSLDAHVKANICIPGFCDLADDCGKPLMPCRHPEKRTIRGQKAEQFIEERKQFCL